MRKWIAGVLAVLVAVGCSAELKLPSLFSDGMVLQRDQQVPVWGWGEPGEAVTVSFAGQVVAAKADKDGKFMARLQKMSVSAEPQVMSISTDRESVEINNVLIGDVWLCSGQSNMHFATKNAKDFQKEQAEAHYPLIRMFSTGLETSRTLLESCTGSWVVCSPDSVGDFSAVAFFFGRDLHKSLGIPVGLLRSAWGGSPIEAWSPMESLEKYPSAMAYKAEMDRMAETFDEAAAEKHNTRVWADYDSQVELAKANGTKWPPWPVEKIHPHKSHQYPANLYNSMIHPLAPYGLRGAIWYQGENNTRDMTSAVVYRNLLENMVVQWRKDWKSDFPFYAVQLVNFHPPVSDPVQDKAWARIREGFLKFHKEVPNVGIAVGIDVGEANDIHPKDKQTIGFRLARQALANTYGMDIVPGGPIYRSMQKEGEKMVIRFDDIGSGLVAQVGKPLKWFAIAGSDKKFVAAQATIVGDTVVVSSAEVPDPVAVRYAWADNPVGCNLFNKEGFPASPFRTDDWAPMGE